MTERSTDLQTVICIGSNVACRRANIDYACKMLSDVCRDCITSGVYETDDDSGLGAPYLNMVVICRCIICREALQTMAKKLEKDCGRDECSKVRGEMPLDIDIVVWEGDVVDDYEFGRPYFIEGYRRVSPAFATT